MQKNLFCGVVVSEYLSTFEVFAHKLPWYYNLDQIQNLLGKFLHEHGKYHRQSISLVIVLNQTYNLF